MRVTLYDNRQTLWRRGCALLAPLMLWIAPLGLSAMTDLYELRERTGQPFDMSGSTQIFGTCQDYNDNGGSSSLLPIGFTFNFDGTDYTQFAVNAAGHMSLGQQTDDYYYSPRFPEYSTQMSYPMIVPAWFSYAGTSPDDGEVTYKVTGEAPNRVLIVEWSDIRYYYYCTNSGTSYRDRFYGNFQARLYEGSNKIEFWYGDMFEGTTYSYYTAIGIATSDSRYISVHGNNFPEDIYVNGESPTYNYRQLDDSPISKNTVYEFNPCSRDIDLVGNEADGGTAEMEEGDILLSDMEVMRGSSASYRPFSIGVPADGCNDLTYSITIQGSAAGDYTTTAGTVRVGETVSPEVIFTPQAIGDRSATITLTLRDPLSVVEEWTWTLEGEGLTRIDWMATVEEGGVAGMPDGATLLSNVRVERHGSRVVTPFTLTNFNQDPDQVPAEVTYLLEDPYDQYDLDLTAGTVAGDELVETGEVTLGAGESTTPRITFSPDADGLEYGAGPQPATLTVIADGERRVYALAGYSIAPAMEIAIEGERTATSDRNFFRGVVTCVGNEPTVLELRLENVNRVPVEIESLSMFEVDGRVQQGTPRYPQAIDPFGNPVPSEDYRVMEGPAMSPTNREVQFPLTLQPGESRTYYLTYIAQRPGTRYARAFFRTNAVNFYGAEIENFIPGDEPRPEAEGMMTLDFFGRGLGSALASGPDGGLDGLALTFDPVKVGESTVTETTLYNAGECDLRISRDHAHLTTGDVDEFELLEVFGETTVDGQDYVIAPGGSATISARFTPSRSGSRRATVMLRTNDSSLVIDGVTARGVYYLNLYGIGRADLRAFDLVLDPAVIDGPGSTGTVRLVNTSSEVVELTGAMLEGANIAEITEDATNRWPTLPLQLQPDDVVEFGVALTPLSGGEPGIRNAEIVFSYGDGQSVRASISGLVGTRDLTASPATLFDGVNLPVGTVMRRNLVLTNTGTFPVAIGDVRIEGAGAASYEVRTSGRTMIDAGAFEFIEVTFVPTLSGDQSATLVIESNARGGDLLIALNGAATGSQFGGGSSGSNGAGEATEGVERNRGEERTGASLSLSGIVPNPARESAGIGFVLPAAGMASLAIYGLNGELVELVRAGEMGEGEHSVDVDVTDLPTGTYIVRLEQGGHIVTGSLRVVQ